jgi:type VI secretion system secreted protein VgrG
LSSFALDQFGFLSALSQDTRLITMETPLGEEALIVEHFSGQESISELFRFEVDCLSTSAHFALKDILGAPVSLRLRLADGNTRAFHAIAVAMQALGGDGGLARYRLTLAPWMQLLTLRRDSYVFQDMSVPDILEDIFRDYPQAACRFDIRTTLPKRSLTIQYQETDYDFIRRLLAEEGLNFFFEHADDANGDSSSPAGHTLVVFDDNAALAACAQDAIRFQRASPTETQDTVTLLTRRDAGGSNQVALGSWDYKSLNAVAAQDATLQSADGVPALEVFEGAGSYRYTDSAESTRIARVRAESLGMRQQILHAESSVRALAVGSWFSLMGHSSSLTPKELVVLSISHRGANNVSAGHASPDADGKTPIEPGTYRNQFTCVPRSVPVRPAYWLPKPTAPGGQVALVVGVEGEVLTTERDHRVKVQFPWQRGDNPAQGQWSHPSTSNAPGNDTVGTWVRVAEAFAGANYGSAFVPRIGQEVLLHFVAGDIDRPIVVGQLYNGADTPPLHGADNHPGALSGIRSQELASDGSNQWTMDDTPGQSRLALSSSSQSSQWNAGYLVRQQGNVRGSYRGLGFELASDAWNSLRAQHGIFLSTASRRQGTSTQLDSKEAQQKFKAAADLAQTLSDAAVRHRAQGLTTPEGAQSLNAVLDASASSDGAQATAFSQPVAVVDGTAGVALASPASSVLSAGQDAHLVANNDLRFTSGQATSIAASAEVSLFANEGGAKLVATASPVSLRAHTDAATFVADQAVTVTSSNDAIVVQAKGDVLLASGGGYVKIGGGNVEIHAPAAVSVKGVTHDFLGGDKLDAELPPLPNDLIHRFDEQFTLKDKSGNPLAGAYYTAKLPSGELKHGIADAQGKTQRFYTNEPQRIEIHLGHLEA